MIFGAVPPRIYIATRPVDYAARIGTLGNRLSDFGRREEALQASQEATDICRRLAETRPDTFLPDLATSLGALGHVLSEREHHEAATGAYREGLTIIAPFVEEHRDAFGELARVLRSECLRACRRAGIAPDAPLLERVAPALGEEDDREDNGAAENSQSDSPDGGYATQDEQSAPRKAKRSWWPLGGKG